MQINGYLKKKRVIIFCAVIILFSLYIIYSYAAISLNFKNKSKNSSNADFQNEQTTPEIMRGSIVDRNGKMLAVPKNFYNVGISPNAISDPQKFASLFAEPLQLSEDYIVSIILSQRNSQFFQLKKKVDEDVYDQLKKITAENGFFTAVRFDKLQLRNYPENELASHVIGFMKNDGTGASGIEYSMQNQLSPPFKVDAPFNPYGKNIYLTIDANLQFKLEKIAQEAMKNTQASNLMLIAAEAKTGEILSYISLPSANLNDYGNATEEEKKNTPVTEMYEPGSVFKIFLIASFIDSGAINENDSFLCDGIFERTTKSGEKIKITCLDHHGWITAKDALKYSCNDALAQMSEKIESEEFLNRLRSFGFGSKTGIELPAETEGLVRSTSSQYWSARSKPTIAIGQEILVSAVQMVQATTAFANKGSPVKLTLIKKIESKDHTIDSEHLVEFLPPILNENTADYILQCMETVAKSGTGSRANLNDISIGVKTGTAQMADKINGGYSKTDFISNCMAIFPIEDPQIILYIVIQKAKGETYAGRIVAPVIAEAASVIIDHIGMSRGDAASLAHSGLVKIQGNRQISIDQTVPDLIGLPKRNLLQLLNNPNLKIKINGDGWVISQTPSPGTPLTKDTEIELFLE